MRRFAAFLPGAHVVVPGCGDADLTSLYASKTIDFGGELRKAIEPRLALAPIVFLSRVAADVLDPFQQRALAPVVDQLGFRPARVAQPRFEIIEDVVADRNSIRFDFSAHDHFKAQPELPGRISLSEIIVADEADIKEDAAGADFRTDLLTDI
jgi:hypothetical protein